MFNNKGSTLIESLFAFQIYISIVVLFVVLLTQLYDGENRLKRQYISIQNQEEKILYQENFIDIIKMALH
ncbi:MAG: hypothetical protein HFF36_05360 [Coprobacillus sp.]|nr:hypothetical protein [Coprobacillus sp.]